MNVLLAGWAWQDPATAFGLAFSNSVAESVKTAFAANATASQDTDRVSLASESFLKVATRGKTGVKNPVPGVVAVVYEEFFNKGSAVAVKLLQVCPSKKAPRETFSVQYRFADGAAGGTI